MYVISLVPEFIWAWILVETFLFLDYLVRVDSSRESINPHDP